MSEKYKFNNPEGIYFVTCTIVYWIDLFTRKEHNHIITNTLKKYQEKRSSIIYAFCIMPSHIHLIISSKDTTESLSDIIRDFKKLSNKKITEEITSSNECRKEWLLRAFQKAGNKLKRIKSNKMWQNGNRPIELDNIFILQQKLDYIHNNPVEAEIVDEAVDYKYSSTKKYAGIKRGLLDIELSC